MTFCIANVIDESPHNHKVYYSSADVNHFAKPCINVRKSPVHMYYVLAWDSRLLPLFMSKYVLVSAPPTSNKAIGCFCHSATLQVLARRSADYDQLHPL